AGGLAAGLGSSGGSPNELTGRTGAAAPRFSLASLTDPGRTVELSRFADEGLVINFWASWCFPCQQEMSVLQQASAALRGKIAFLGVDTNDTRTAALGFLSRVHVTYPTAFDPGGRVSRAYGLFGLPTTVFVSRRGTVLGRHSGQLDAAGLRGALRQAFGTDLSSATPAAAAPGAAPVAGAFAGVAQVGALFAGSLSAVHFCTAAVVDSPGRDLVATAAHCVAGTGTGLVFAPGYHDGVAPYGSWQVEAAYADPAWTTSQDPRRDLALLVLAPRTEGGRSVDVEDVTSGYDLVGAPAPGGQVTVIGYPIGTGGRPIRCTAAVTATAGYPTFGCGGFVAGTSGSPWIAPGAAGESLLEGVVGGLHQGGCSPSVSYSSSFGAWAPTLYGRAVEGGPGDTLPVAGADGC
ncbi:MAG: redoxin domain-containing protein, partial [Acidobacteriota bacterium]|nr:redoxin domain-containing protein [Acidobacteriota bacterium]